MCYCQSAIYMAKLTLPFSNVVPLYDMGRSLRSSWMDGRGDRMESSVTNHPHQAVCPVFPPGCHACTMPPWGCTQISPAPQGGVWGAR